MISTPNRETHSPGNKLEDKPFNQFHTIEWTPLEFADLVRSHFPDRQVRFLSQEARWPGLIREGLDENAMYTIAVIGDGELPQWARIGMSIPTRNAARTQDAILGFSKYYPGEIEFAIVANGRDEPNLAQLRQLESELPHIVHIIEEPENLGYGRGANRGLDYLWQEAWFDLYAVSNDDVYPAVDCIPQLVAAFEELRRSPARSRASSVPSRMRFPAARRSSSAPIRTSRRCRKRPACGTRRTIPARFRTSRFADSS